MILNDCRGIINTFFSHFPMIKSYLLFCFLLFHLTVLAQVNQPVEVKIVASVNSFQLMRGGKPYFIKGAGGYDHFDLLRKCGGNSIRIWEHEQAKAILNQAEKLGLTVMVGLWVGHERHGFDYNDNGLVDRQLEMFRKIVIDLKDHPALLLWGVGNEVNLNYNNKKVWDAIQGIAKMIHEEDKNHPTVAVIAGVNQEDVSLIKAQCPDIDVLGVNVYGAVTAVPDQLKKFGWDRPYIITEWGPTGHWESAKTKWGAAIEPSSTIKAADCKRRYEQTIVKDADHCLGSYVFKWGNKQEVTATWYSTLLETGEETELVDVMRTAWNGPPEKNKVPQLKTFTLDGKEAVDNIELFKKEEYNALATSLDADGDQLTYSWEIMKETLHLKAGGDQEDTPSKVFGQKTGSNGQLNFKAPRRKGYYRLFIYVYDGHNHVATGNIPFQVKSH
jgi:hypothetical protein